MGQHRFKRQRDVKCPECGNYFSSQGIAGHRRGAHGIMQGNGINTVRRMHDVENLPAQQVEITRSLDELRQQMSTLARIVEQGLQQQGRAVDPHKARAALVQQLAEIQAERKQLQDAAEEWRKQLEPLKAETEELDTASRSWGGIGAKSTARLAELRKQLEPMQRKVEQYDAQIQHCNDEESNTLDQMSDLDKPTRSASRSNYNAGNGNGNGSRS